MFLIILNQIIKMLLLMLFGAICYKVGLIDQKGNEMLANLVMLVVNPIVVFMAAQTDYSPHLVMGLLISYALATITHALMAIVSTILVKKGINDDYSIERMSMMYANCGFIGIPLIQSILGSEGVLYLTAYMTVFNVFAWSHGLVLMTGKTSVKDVLKGLMTPAIVACFSGLILYFLQIRLPDLLSDTLNYIGGMNTPIAMMIAGISLAQTDLLRMFQNKKLYFNAFGKLFLMPALVLATMAIAGSRIPTAVSYTILVAAACPSAGTCTNYALMFHKNYKYASEIHVFSTLICILSIPMFVYAAERLLP